MCGEAGEWPGWMGLIEARQGGLCVDQTALCQDRPVGCCVLGGFFATLRTLSLDCASRGGILGPCRCKALPPSQALRVPAREQVVAVVKKALGHGRVHGAGWWHPVRDLIPSPPAYPPTPTPTPPFRFFSYKPACLLAAIPPPSGALAPQVHQTTAAASSARPLPASTPGCTHDALDYPTVTPLHAQTIFAIICHVHHDRLAAYNTPAAPATRPP